LDNSFFWTTPGLSREFRVGSGGDVFAYHGKVTRFHFEDVGASVTARAGAESVSNGGIEQATDEHA
jgi:hypothetical protein